MFQRLQFILASAEESNPEMIESFDIPKSKVARWAGITSAVFSLSQAPTGIFWLRASDRFGRKPVIMVGLFCTMLACLLFGFSRSLLWAIAARAFAGSVNGNVGIISTTATELVPQKELQPKAFSIMPLVWTIGTIIGPALSGTFANPAAKHARFFGRSDVFKRHPFSLPKMVASLVFLVGLSTGSLFRKEPLETRKHRHDYGRVIGRLLLRPLKQTKKLIHWYHENQQSAFSSEAVTSFFDP